AATPHEWRAGGFPSLSGDLWRVREPYLRRPFSIADRWQGSGNRQFMAIISRNIGPGTDFLEHVRPGSGLGVAGPSGRGSDVRGTQHPSILVGGGVGIPPLLYAVRTLTHARHSPITVVFGVTSADLLPLRVHAQPDSTGVPTPCVELPGNAP